MRFSLPLLFPFLLLNPSAVRSYAHQLSLIFSLASLIALVLTLIGTATVGRGLRTEKLRSGWKLVAGLMTLQAVCLMVASSLVAYERNNDGRFSVGVVHLGASFLSRLPTRLLPLSLFPDLPSQPY